MINEKLCFIGSAASCLALVGIVVMLISGCDTGDFSPVKPSYCQHPELRDSNCD